MSVLRKKILAYLITCDPKSALSRILNNLSSSFISDSIFEIEILIIHDDSKDPTDKEPCTNKISGSSIPITLLTNPFEIGHGGNQKLAFNYAIERGFNVIVSLLESDQCTSETFIKLVDPLLTGEVQAVYGFEAKRFFQFLNPSILQPNCSAYCTKALSTIPFHLNSNHHDFNIDLLIQLNIKGAKIKSISLPVCIGNDTHRFSFLKYAQKIIFCTLARKLHNFGIFYNPKYDFNPSNPYQSKFHFYSSHSKSLEYIKGNEKILSLGSGPIELVEPFIKKGAKVSILDQDIDQHKSGDCEEAISIDLDSLDLNLLKTNDRFDLILALDIIEHLKSPEKLLEELSRDKRLINAKIIITTPNIAFIAIRAMLLFGQFNYGNRGILDITHTRLLTFRSLKRMLTQSGYKIEKLEGIPVPFPIVINSHKLSSALIGINNILIKLAPSLFSFQIYCEARIGCSSHILLEATKEEHINQIM